MTPRLRKFVLTAHVTLSVGWLGAVAGFLALAIAGFPTYGLTWPVAWILGSMARRELRQHPELYVGGNALNTGWVMGIVGTAIGTVVLLAMMASGVR